jgi:hypothetical protein
LPFLVVTCGKVRGVFLGNLTMSLLGRAMTFVVVVVVVSLLQ